MELTTAVSPAGFCSSFVTFHHKRRIFSCSRAVLVAGLEAVGQQKVQCPVPERRETGKAKT